MSVDAQRDIINFGLLMILGVFIYYRNPKSKVNIIFFFYCLSIAIWDYADFKIITSQTQAEANFWANFDAIWMFEGTFLTLFVIMFSEKIAFLRRKITYIILFAPAILSVIIDLLTNSITGYPQMTDNGFQLYWDADPITFFFYFITGIWIFGLSIINNVILIRYFSKLKDSKKRKKTFIILLGTLVSTLLGVMDGIAYATDSNLPEIFSFSLTFYTFIVAFAIIKYRLFSVTPESTADSIISSMDDILFITDKDLLIKDVNNKTVEILGFDKAELIGKNFDELFSPLTDTSTKLLNILTVEMHNEKISFESKDGEYLSYSISSTQLYSPLGDPIGHIFIGRDFSLLESKKKEIEKKISEVTRLNKLFENREEELTKLKNQLLSK